MQQHRAPAKFLGRFNGDNRVAQGRAARRVAPGAQTNIENPTWRLRDQVQDGSMCIGKRDALVALEQLRGLIGVVFGSAD